MFLCNLEGGKMTPDERLEKMIRLAEVTGQPLDLIVEKLRYLDHKTFVALSDNPSRLPRYMKSSVKP
jgi:hypothetical protein